VNALRPEVFAPQEVSHFAGHALDYAAHAGFDAMLFIRLYLDLNSATVGERGSVRYTGRHTTSMGGAAYPIAVEHLSPWHRGHRIACDMTLVCNHLLHLTLN
jgi:hypothetical protein